MKIFLSILSILALSVANLSAQDSTEEGTVIITAQDEEFCPFCNAIAAAQANNCACLIVVQAPDGSTQMTSCPLPAKATKACKPCPKCNSKMPATEKKLGQDPTQAEKVLDKNLHD